MSVLPTSNPAMSSGLEWNVKLTTKDMLPTIQKMEATFDSYWNTASFEVYEDGCRERLERALSTNGKADPTSEMQFVFDIQPYPYQQEILDKLEAERTVRGYTRNLVVAATGTGKTVISALDYKRFRKQNPDRPCRLLFVAHREEILKQSLYTFRAVLKDVNFGELFVGNYKPESIDNLFLSIQTFNSQSFTEKTSPDFYDYIIVDEFHHAAAPTYQKLLSYYQPRILLGLTATPERMDGKNILPYFSNRIAAEIRLPEAIDRKLLCPFQYFGVTDTVDLDALKWSAGGYQKSELEHIYTFSGAVADRRADHVVTALLKYVTDIDEVKGLGFCVTVDHAEFMCRYFNDHNIPSMFLTGQSSDEERAAAKRRLVSGEVRFIFVVDIYNEGVDIYHADATAYGYETDLAVDVVSSATIRSVTLKNSYKANSDGTQTVTTPVTRYIRNADGTAMAVTLESSSTNNFRPVALFTFEYAKADTKPDVIYGDVNGDGIINSTDAAIVYRSVNGRYTLTDSQKLSADVNGDGAVNSTDAALIYRYTNGKMSKFPAES